MERVDQQTFAPVAQPEQNSAVRTPGMIDIPSLIRVANQARERSATRAGRYRLRLSKNRHGTSVTTYLKFDGETGMLASDAAEQFRLEAGPVD
jgi:hypothetical protein